MVAGTMDGPSGLMLFGAGLAGGIVTAVVGGASLITFPALLAAGLPPIVANASNAVALMPGNFVGGIADLSVDGMKRLASRSTWWHMLPHKSYTRSTTSLSVPGAWRIPRAVTRLAFLDFRPVSTGHGHGSLRAGGREPLQKP